MNNVREQKTYVCKRARMCSFLIEKGFTPYKVAPDRDNPMYDVFLFTASPELYQAVMEYINTRSTRVVRECMLRYVVSKDSKPGYGMPMPKDMLTSPLLVVFPKRNRTLWNMLK